MSKLEIHFDIEVFFCNAEYFFAMPSGVEPWLPYPSASADF